MPRPPLRTLLFNRTGRVRRWTFFTFAPPIVLAALPLYVGLAKLLAASFGIPIWTSSAGRSMAAGHVAGIAALIVLALAGSALLPLLIKRLHDSNLTGWWLIPVATPVVLNAAGWALGLNGTSEQPTMIGELLKLSIIATLGLIPIALWPGTAGANRFGPDPRVDVDVARLRSDLP